MAARAVAAVVIFVCSCHNVLAQSGETQLQGLQVNAGVSRPSGPQDLYCNVGVGFSGPKVYPDGEVTAVRVIRAVDDLGRDLLTGDKKGPSVNEPFREIRLKNPLPDAKTIDLDGEVELRTPTIPCRLIFTNAAAHLGQILKHPLLDQYQIKITTLSPETWPGRSAGFQWEDPWHKLDYVRLQNRDGTDASGISESEFNVGTNKIISINVPETPLRDLDFVVKLEVPLREEKTRFKIRNIPLPWVQPPNLEVTFAEALRGKKMTNEDWMLLVTFKGGPLTNAMGIRRVSITKAEGAASENLKTTLTDVSPYSFDPRYDLEKGGTVTKEIWIHTQSTPLKMIKTLEGDAELLHDSPSNISTTYVTCDLKAGETITNPKLDENGVRFKFVGVQNFNTAEKRLEKSDDFVFWGWPQLDPEAPENVKDSVLFSYEDPRLALLSHAALGAEFLNSQGYRIQPRGFICTPKSDLLRFKELPEKARFFFYFVNHADIRRVHFKAENLPVH